MSLSIAHGLIRRRRRRLYSKTQSGTSRKAACWLSSVCARPRRQEPDFNGASAS